MFLIRMMDIIILKYEVCRMPQADIHLRNSTFFNLWGKFSPSIAEDWVLGVIPVPPLLHLIPLSSSFVFCVN